MRLPQIEARVIRLDAARRRPDLTNLSADELQRRAFESVHRMVQRHGDIATLLRHWDREMDPRVRRWLDRLHVLIPDLASWYGVQAAQRGVACA